MRGFAISRLAGAESDATLVGRVAGCGCPEAVAALHRRHGPMVLGACRRLLGPGPDADDAAQAVWLVLLRRAGSVRPPGRVGPWLHGVAVRTARHVRSRRRRWVPLPDLPDPRPAPDRELAARVDAELMRLPFPMRAAVLLCVVEGRSLKEAAAELGVPVGTLASRLARGRQRLADGLRRQGLLVSAAGLSGFLGAEATVTAAGPASAAAMTLSRRVLTMMVLDKLKRVAAGLVLAGGLAAGGAGVVLATADPPAAPTPAAATNPDPEVVRLWGRMNNWDDGPATVALLELARRPAAAVVPFLRDKLRPVQLTKERAAALLADLLGDDPKASDAAVTELHYHNPRLVMTVDEVWAAGKTPRDRQRLASVLVGKLEGHDHLDYTLRRVETGAVRGDGLNEVRYNLHFDWLPDTPDAVVAAAANSPARDRGGVVITCDGTVGELSAGHTGWARAARGVALLELIGTPDAVAHLRAVAAGHPDARPTSAAKAALARLAART